MTQTPSAMPNALIADRFPLWGSRLIEASAGTGKTWTIAALYLRLVLGHGDADSAHGRPLAPPEILVMTFTKAATRELSDRIRQRLLEAARCFRAEQAVDDRDEFLTQVMRDFPAGAARNQAAWRLAMAAEGMDEASVHTIDAWCQRMLREHAFDSGSLFDEELVADEQALLTEAVQDYWRSECYPLSAELLEQVLGIWKDIDALRHDVAQLMHHGIEMPSPGQSLQALITGWASTLPSPAERTAHVAAMQQWLQTELQDRRAHWSGIKLKQQSVEKWFEQLAQWASQDSPLKLPELGTGLNRLTPAGLLDARTKAAPAALVLPPSFAWFESVAAHYQAHPFNAVLRRHAAAHVAQRLSRLKRQSRSFGFADMLERLGSALHGPHGARLRERILAQYPVALIDEFQDTSPLQYDIFDQIYRSDENARERALLLIGDPKQSIYGFRGADIYSYLRARQATEGRHYVLGTNYRSTTALVEAVNHCFMQAEQARPQAAFRFSSQQGNPLPFVEVAAQGRRERLVGPEGDMPALTLVHDLELQNADSARARFAGRCAERIATWLNEPATGFASEPGRFERLRPRDIAVLVRTGKEAAAVRLALQRRGIASVYLSDKESVFQSDEARDLVHWLRGVAMPQNAALVRAALATASIGLSLDELGQIASDDEAFDRHGARLQELHQVWQRQGVLAMLRHSLHQFQLAARWLDQDLGGERRLTNFLHLAELLQHASRHLDGEQAQIRWLQQQIDDGASEADERIIRLESDADLVKVITIHKSKGLEFPLVCLPFPTSFRAVSSRFAQSLCLPDPQGARQLILNPGPDDIDRADQERLREDLRLLYVALTRPRHALWVGFAALKVGNAKDCQSHKSAIGYLLGGDQALEPADWLARLASWAQGCPAIALEAAADTTAETRLAAGQAGNALVSAPRFDTPIERDWSISSYSRLSSSVREAAPASSSMRSPRSSDDEITLAAGEAEPLVQAVPLQRTALPIQHAFARGPLAGSFLHDQLEWLARRGFALGSESQLGEQLRLRLEHSDYGERAAEVIEWLQCITHTPLPGPGVALARLQTARPEMEFWLPAERIQLGVLDRICQDHLLPGVERPALQSTRVHGMLMGFADLVFEHEGRYWVLDYKSSHLGPSDQQYGREVIAQAMARHRYDVQAAIYLGALHRLLASRLGERYDPRQHMGGAVFLFLRGIHHPDHGACTLQPEADFYTRLDAMLAPEALSA